MTLATQLQTSEELLNMRHAWKGSGFKKMPLASHERLVVNLRQNL